MEVLGKSLEGTCDKRWIQGMPLPLLVFLQAELQTSTKVLPNSVENLTYRSPDIIDELSWSKVVNLPLRLLTGMKMARLTHDLSYTVVLPPRVQHIGARH